MRRWPLAWLLFAPLSACAPTGQCDAADLTPLRAEPAFAVVLSDYTSSAIALLDADGALITEAWLDSGTVDPTIVASLSGDVVLPTSPLERCRLVVIDRLGTDVLTFFDLCGGGPLAGQLDVGSGFRANPQDVILTGDGRLFISRAEPNFDLTAPPLERGNDIVIADADGLRITGRIDLSGFDLETPERLYARPGRMARLLRGDASRIIVGLARSSRDHHVAGPGAVAVIDETTHEVSLIELPGLVGCGEVDVVPGRPDRAVVTCFGPNFATEEERRGGAGLTWLELDGSGQVSVVGRRVTGEEGPVFNGSTVPISTDRVVTTAMGDLVAGIEDRVAVLEHDEVTEEAVFEAGTAFVVGDGAFEPAARLLLIPDAETGTIRRFEVSEATELSELEAVPVSGCRGLPPREVRALR